MPRRPIPPPVPQPRIVEEAFARMFDLNNDDDVKEIARISNMAIKEQCFIQTKNLLENKDGNHKIWMEWIEFSTKSAEQVELDIDEEEVAAAEARQPFYDADDLDALEGEDIELDD